MHPVRDFYYVYILQNSSGLLYAGATSDLKKRISEHRNGMSQYTSSSGRYKLVYYEACLNKDDAFRREKYLKSGMGKRYIKNRINPFLGKDL